MCILPLNSGKLTFDERIGRSEMARFTMSVDYIAQQTADNTARTTRSNVAKHPPPKFHTTRGQQLALALDEGLTSVYVGIDVLLVPEAVIGKREVNNKYQYLVKYDKLSYMCNSWVPVDKIMNKALVEKFERERFTPVPHKEQTPTWLLQADDFIVQWMSHPYFVVPCGGGQTNKFCVVGLDKAGVSLKCKHTKEPHVALHQLHAGIVKREMTRRDLVIFNKKIIPKGEATDIPEEKKKEPTRAKPYSTSPVAIQLQPAVIAKLAEIALRKNSLELQPPRPTGSCKCFNSPKNPQCQYKQYPTREAQPVSLWLEAGAPVTGINLYYWQCLVENPECRVYYDGVEDGIFNYSNKTLVSHPVLIEFLFSLITGKGETFDGYVSRKAMMNKYCYGYTGHTKVAFLQKATFIKVL